MKKVWVTFDPNETYIPDTLLKQLPKDSTIVAEYSIDLTYVPFKKAYLAEENNRLNVHVVYDSTHVHGVISSEWKIQEAVKIDTTIDDETYHVIWYVSRILQSAKQYEIEDPWSDV